MKITRIACSIAVALVSLQHAFGQTFTNLDFESATITAILVNDISGFYAYAATTPGWSVNTVNYIGGAPPNTVPYNNEALDAPSVNLEGTFNQYGPVAVQGLYSAYLQGGSSFAPPPHNGASIWQTGQIPTTAQSITYWGNALQVTFNGHALSLVPAGGGANNTVWGADVSPYAGQAGVLMFTAYQSTSPTDYGYMLDNIQFSPRPIPEPTPWSLGALGIIYLFRRARLANKTD